MDIKNNLNGVKLSKKEIKESNDWISKKIKEMSFNRKIENRKITLLVGTESGKVLKKMLEEIFNKNT